MTLYYLIALSVCMVVRLNGAEAKTIFGMNDTEYTFDTDYLYPDEKNFSIIIKLELSPLHVYSLETKQLTEQNLLATAPAAVANESLINFKITKPPLSGNIFSRWNDGVFHSTTSFTQWEVSEGRIYYEHTGPNMEDSFMFDVKCYCPSEALTNLKFRISIVARPSNISDSDNGMPLASLNMTQDYGSQKNMTLNNYVSISLTHLVLGCMVVSLLIGIVISAVIVIVMAKKNRRDNNTNLNEEQPFQTIPLSEPPVVLVPTKQLNDK